MSGSSELLAAGDIFCRHRPRNTQDISPPPNLLRRAAVPFEFFFVSSQDGLFECFTRMIVYRVTDVAMRSVHLLARRHAHEISVGAVDDLQSSDDKVSIDRHIDECPKSLLFL